MYACCRLFTYVNETLFERPIYKTLINIYKHHLFNPAVCTPESPMEGERQQLLREFFDLLVGSKCFNLAYNYLKARGRAPQDYDKFVEQTFNLWFGTYSRCRGALGSSGFEHVFVGEQKGEIVDGQHSWVRYYLLEKAGECVIARLSGCIDRSAALKSAHQEKVEKVPSEDGIWF